MTPQMMILALAAGLMLVLLLVCVFMLARQARRMKTALDEARLENRDALERMTYELTYLLGERQQDVNELLRNGNNSILNTLQSVTELQSGYLERISRQMSGATREQEERLDRLYRHTEESLKKYDSRMETISRTLDERLERSRQTLENGMARMQADNGQKLDEMRRTVDEKLHETLDKRLNESFSQVSQRLEQVYKGLGEMQTLAAGVGDLKKVLTNVKTRGIWGEMQLSALLAQMLSPAQYEENVAVERDSQERVEFAVKLPGHDDGTVYLPIDSKFPQEAYTRLMEASDAGDRDAAESSRKELIARLNEEGKRIAGKYIRPPVTTDFAIMFLPVEGLYAELMRDMDVVETLQRKHRVVVAGPSTLAALLNSLQMGFRTLAIEKRSGEVWKLLGAVKTDFSRFADMLEKTQTRLKQASDSIDSAFTQTRRIERQLKKVESLEQGEAQTLLDRGEV